MIALVTQKRTQHSAPDAEQDEGPVQQKRVLLGDDNPAILNIVRELLEPEYLIVGAVTDGQSVLRGTEILKPDVVVLDISMGEPNGIQVARQLQGTSHDTTVVFLTVYEFAEFVRAALAVGATAYVFKSRLYTDLVPALRAACAGRTFVSPKTV
jgi:DNA-binding NarL/FixJ family response regulator